MPGSPEPTAKLSCLPLSEGGDREKSSLKAFFFSYGPTLIFLEGCSLGAFSRKKFSLKLNGEFLDILYFDRHVGELHLVILEPDLKIMGKSGDTLEFCLGEDLPRFFEVNCFKVSDFKKALEGLSTPQRSKLISFCDQKSQTAPITWSLSLKQLAQLLRAKDFAPPLSDLRIKAYRDGWILGSINDSSSETEPLQLRVAVDGILLEPPLSADLPCPEHENDPNRRGFAIEVPQRFQDEKDHDIGFFCARTLEEFDSSPYRIGPSHFDAKLTLTPEGILVGMIHPRSVHEMNRSLEVEITADGRVIDRLWLQPNPPKESSPSLRNDLCFRFKKRLPDSVFDTERHLLGLNLVLHDGRRWRAAESLILEARYRGFIDIAEPERIAGWILNESAPLRRTALDVFLNGKKMTSGRTSLLRSDVLKDAPCGFDIQIPPRNELTSTTLSFSFRLAGTDRNPLGTDIIYIPLESAIQSLTELAAELRTSQKKSLPQIAATPDDSANFWLRTQIIEPIINGLRDGGQLDKPLTLSPRTFCPKRQKGRVLDAISVLIPVYEGLESSIRCIHSVLASGGMIPFTLTVINDASPNPELTQSLRDLQKIHGFTLLEQKSNLGFVATVNRHLSATPQQDVVLLNADTVVHSGWLDRLHAAAYSADNIGTVTPLSNNATLVSYPIPFKENPLLSKEEIQLLDELCASVNAGHAVDIPTGVGFCLFLKRAMIDEVGFLDHRRFGKGYGEENDYCLRASQKGWRHITACNVYVGHEGSVSFGTVKKDLLQKNLNTLNSLYPDYAKTIERFQQRDPMAIARNRIAREQLGSKLKHAFLFITHGLGGGTERAVRDLAQRIEAEGQSVLILRSERPNRWVIRTATLDEHLVYRGSVDFEILLGDLKNLAIRHIHFHQTMHFPSLIWDLPAQLRLPYDVTIHDFLTLCPRITFLDGRGKHCGQKQWDTDACERCIEFHGLPDGVKETLDSFDGNVASWRSRHRELLVKARKVFAPSESAASPFRKHFDLKNIEVKSHPDASKKSSVLESKSPKILIGQDGIIRIAVIGAIGESKGFSLLQECIVDADLRELPLLYQIIGYTQDDETLLAHENVQISGRYQPEQGPEVIRQSGAGIALFLSPWPETWSYTLTEALEEGLYPVSLDIGAIAERMRGMDIGEILPRDSDASQINNALLALADERNTHAVHITPEPDPYEAILEAYYGIDTDKWPKNRNKAADRKNGDSPLRRKSARPSVSV